VERNTESVTFKSGSWKRNKGKEIFT